MIWLLIGYMFLFIHRPFEIWPELGEIRLERMYMLLILFSALISGRLQPRANLMHAAIAAMLVAVIASWLFSPWAGSELAQKTVFDWLKTVVFYVLAVSLCRDRREFTLLVIGLVAATGLYVTHSVYEYQLGRRQFSMGVRRLIGINITLKHPNSFAAVALITMPFAFFLFRHAETKLIRAGAAIYVLIATYGTLLTSSRMGFVGIIFLVFMLWLRSRHKVRMFLALLVISAVVWPLLGESKQNRILSLYDSSYAPANAKVSADGRKESFWDGMALFQRFPLTGCGPGGWQPATGKGTSSHNLYGQVPGELGAAGVLGFVFLVGLALMQSWQLWRWPQNAREITKADAEFWSDTGVMFMRVVLIMLLFGLAGGSLFRYYWIWTAALIAVARPVFVDEWMMAAARPGDPEEDPGR